MLKILDLPCGIYHIHDSGLIQSQRKFKMPQVQLGGGYDIVEMLADLKPRKYTLNNRGYYALNICGKTYMVHRLVAEYFVPNPDAKPFVNHIDGNKLNNCATNLEWVTCAENLAHARVTGLFTSQGLINSTQALLQHNESLKLPATDVQTIREIYIPRHKEYGGVALSKIFNTTPTTISDIVNHKHAYA